MTQWILKLVGEIKADKKEKTASKFDIKMIIEETANKQAVKKSRSVSETSEPENCKKRAARLSSTSEVIFVTVIMTAKASEPTIFFYFACSDDKDLFLATPLITVIAVTPKTFCVFILIMSSIKLLFLFLV